MKNFDEPTISKLAQQLKERLQHHQPRQIDQPTLAPAAVLVAIEDSPEPQIILTRRASHMNSHSGEVAFPGGRQDPEDSSIEATALREAEEEVGLNPSDVLVIGELDQVVSRYGYLVTPILAVVPPGLSLVPNPDELDAVFRVPLSLFTDEPSQYFERDGLKIPSYDFEEFHIWGLTAMMIVEMVNHLWEGEIELRF